MRISSGALSYLKRSYQENKMEIHLKQFGKLFQQTNRDYLELAREHLGKSTFEELRTIVFVYHQNKNYLNYLRKSRNALSIAKDLSRASKISYKILNGQIKDTIKHDEDYAGINPY